MQVLLDRGHKRYLVFVTEDKPILCPYSNRLVSQPQNTLNGIAQKHKLRGSWTSYTTPIAKGLFRTWCCWVRQDSDSKSSIQNLMQLSMARLWWWKVPSRTWWGWVQQTISKRFYSEPDVVKYNKDIVSRNMTSFLVLNHERIRYRNGPLKPYDNHWWDHLANNNINLLQGASTLCLQKLYDSLAKEPISTHPKWATWTLDTKNKKADLQSIVKNNCKHLSANRQRSYCSFFI